MAKAKRKAKRRAKAGARAAAAGLSPCGILRGGIISGKKDVTQDNKAIGAQQKLIARLLAQGAKPNAIQAARDVLANLQNKLEGDEAQLEAFRDEYRANNCPRPVP